MFRSAEFCFVELALGAGLLLLLSEEQDWPNHVYLAILLYCFMAVPPNTVHHMAVPYMTATHITLHHIDVPDMTLPHMDVPYVFLAHIDVPHMAE